MSIIQQTEFKARRQQLMNQMGKNSIAILMAAPEVIRNGDSHYTYRQDSNFYYMTGYNEPDAAVVFIPGRKEGEFIFFNQPNNLDFEIWVGKRIGQEGACRHYGADEAHSIDTLDERMPELLSGKKSIYFAFGSCSELDKRMAGWLNKIRSTVRSGGSAPTEMIDIHAILHEMRLIKSKAEIESLRRAVEISSQAHIEGMKACQKLTHEYQVEAVIWNHLAMHGFRAWAYGPIVGVGKNACVLHYGRNDAPLELNELLLVDAGGEWENYSADLTRTYPTNGKYTAEQRSLYEVVLKSQKAAIDSIKPGSLWTTAQTIIIRVLTEGLVELGLLKGSVDTLIASKAYSQFYMHNSGHWLGLDTHDAGNYKINDEWRTLEPGMVLTVEPGLYVRPHPDVDKRWWNIGIRIEDNILVTESGHEILSQKLPKEVDEIEALMQG